MKVSGKILLCILVWSGLSALRCAAAVYQSDGSAGSVQGLHNAALNGDTITLPTGTFTWSTPVTISKAIHLRGQGSGRIIGNSKSSVTVGAGTKMFTTTRAGLPITAGQVLRIAKMPNAPGHPGPARDVYMEGTVTSYSGTTLTMNITRTGGSGTWKFWWIATRPLTTILNNYNNGTPRSPGAQPMLKIQQALAGSAEVTGIQFTALPSSVSSLIGVTTPNYITPKALIHDCWFQTGNGSSGVAIFAASHQLLVWKCSFDDTYQLSDSEAFQLKSSRSSPIAVSWSTNSTMGTSDVNGATNLYIEDCDFHAHNQVCDADDNSRVVFRHNLMDNSQFANHGADTSNSGMRHAEIYNNELIFDAFPGDCATELPLQHAVWLRGGTAVITDNVFPRISSQCSGTKPNIAFSVLNTRRHSAAYCCWDTYPAPHQVGQGFGPGAVFHSFVNSPCATGDFSYFLYSEPVYVWNNTGTGGNIVSLVQDPTDQCGNGHNVNAWVIAGRDYIIGPKPGYQKFTYPHPLTALVPPPSPPPNATPSPTPSSTSCSLLQQRLDRLQRRQQRLKQRHRSNPRLNRRVRRVQQQLQLQHC